MQQQQMEVDQQGEPMEVVPQSEKQNEIQVLNDAGGFVYALDDMKRLKRFLVLGTEGGSYYAGQQELSVQNAQALMRLIENGQGEEAVQIVREYSVSGRTFKQDPIIFSLALCAKSPDTKTKKAAYKVMNEVLRIPTHLFQFVEVCEALSKAKNSSGWGRAHRTAIKNWYIEKKGKQLATHVTKYKQRNSWSHKDLFRLCHIKPKSPVTAIVVKYVVKGLEKIREDAQSVGVSEEVVSVFRYLEAIERAKTMNETELVQIIREHKLVREHLPTNQLNSKLVWEALLENMPMTAMIRNLGKMTSIGLLEPLTDGADKVCTVLRDQDKLAKAKVHPFTILVALKTYKEGHGEKGKLKWDPNPMIISALDSAFYLAFKNVQPTNKRYLLAIDVSGSMGWGNCCGTTTITPRVASAAMAMVTAHTEQAFEFVGFSHQLVPMRINASMKLDEVLHTVAGLPMGGTDCAQPMLYAIEKNRKVDVFIVYTDSETWAGPVHADEALRRYRKRSGIDAKLIVVAMTSNGFTLADPNDAGMLDIAGFDSNAPEVMRQFVMGDI